MASVPFLLWPSHLAWRHPARQNGLGPITPRPFAREAREVQADSNKPRRIPNIPRNPQSTLFVWMMVRASDHGVRISIRGLTPLVWGHVSPYGAFDLDMDRRLDLELKEAA